MLTYICFIVLQIGYKVFPWAMNFLNLFCHRHERMSGYSWACFLSWNWRVFAHFSSPSSSFHGGYPNKGTHKSANGCPVDNKHRVLATRTTYLTLTPTVFKIPHTIEPGQMAESRIYWIIIGILRWYRLMVEVFRICTPKYWNPQPPKHDTG